MANWFLWTEDSKKFGFYPNHSTQGDTPSKSLNIVQNEEKSFILFLAIACNVIFRTWTVSNHIIRKNWPSGNCRVDQKY